MTDNFTLRNPWLIAAFDPATGALSSLRRAGSRQSLVTGITCRHIDPQHRQWVGESLPANPYNVAEVRGDGEAVTSTLASDLLRIERRMSLAKDSPLLQVEVSITCTGGPAALSYVALPHVQFGPDIADAYEDDHDMYFDGAELGEGRQLPCWRVFFTRNHRAGLLVAARSKRQMSHLEVLADGLRVSPHAQLSYSTMVPRPAMPVRRGHRYASAFEIGPWRRQDHDDLLKAARLHRPVKVQTPAMSGKPRSALKGEVFVATGFAPRAAVSRTFRMDRWHRLAMPWMQGGEGLYAGPGVNPPPLTLDPRLQGVYRIYIGVGHGAGVGVRLSNDPYATFRVAPKEGMRTEAQTAFASLLSGKHASGEVEFRTVRMDGRTITLERFPDRHAATAIDYVRFERLTPAQEQRFEQQEKLLPALPLSGLNDIPDIARFTDAVDPDPQAYASNLWEHANCRFDAVYWRIDGQCSDFPSRHNTMRYISAKVHGVFNPQAKAYGRVLKKVNMLELAVDAAHRHGVRIYGWQRFNNYTGNVQSDFYRKNPEFWEESPDGYRGRKLCLALPEVREHKISILVEAAGYGLDGLCLGFLRHPPVLLYHPALVESYEKKYGKLPPRPARGTDTVHMQSLPPDDPEHVQWFQHRADYMTLFGRELKAALVRANLGHVKINLWLRPNHCLYDGIDLPAWLDEGLCDEVIADVYYGGASHAVARDLAEPTPQWRRMVQAKARLIGGLPCHDMPWVRRRTDEYLQQGFDGLCTYESDVTVLDSRFVQFYRGLRRR